MFGISTYGAPDNFFTKLIAQKLPDGTPMFRQIEYATICKKCIEKGVREVCKHRRGELPHWHDAGEYSQIFKMLEGNQDTALREIGGISADSSIRNYFDSAFTNELANLKSSDGMVNFVSNLGNQKANVIYISVDPCGEGSYSEYGMISATFMNGEVIVSSFFFFFLIAITHTHKNNWGF